jgi:hypothetical protein
MTAAHFCATANVSDAFRQLNIPKMYNLTPRRSPNSRGFLLAGLRVSCSKENPVRAGGREAGLVGLGMLTLPESQLSVTATIGAPTGGCRAKKSAAYLSVLGCSA